MTKEQELHIEAHNYLIKNNYDITSSLKETDARGYPIGIKNAIINAYIAGKQSERSTEEIEEAIKDRIAEDDLLSMGSITVNNI